MFLTKQQARALGVAIVAAVGFSGCATTYVDEFAAIDSRFDQLDARVESAARSAESANQAATRANQRLDSLENRVDQLESDPPRVPRG